MKRKVITAGQAVKDAKPFEWEDVEKRKTKKEFVNNRKTY